MIVIPMAGESKRFKEQGYNKPKFQLPLFGETVFHWSVSSFSRYFRTETFLLICRAEHRSFVRDCCKKLGISDFHIVELNHATQGQAETVLVGLDTLQAPTTNGLTIFNIDTFRREFAYPPVFEMPSVAGFLETFCGTGENWSFVAPGNGDRVARTTEKDPISCYCCTGLYHFSTISDFRLAFQMEQEKPQTQLINGEYYVAPMYNNLIAIGRNIHFTVIPKSDVVFCGVPSEYEALKRTRAKYLWGPDSSFQDQSP